MKPFNLENEPKIKSGFEMPNNYFETFSERLMTKLPIEDVKVISIFQKRKKWLFAVAAILILSLSISVFYQLFNNKLVLDDTTLENYITNQSTISENDIVDLLSENDLKELNIDLKLDEKLIENELLYNDLSEQELLN